MIYYIKKKKDKLALKPKFIDFGVASVDDFETLKGYTMSYCQFSEEYLIQKTKQKETLFQDK